MARSMFYIMKAHHLTTSGRKLNLARILRDHPTCTVLAVTSETSKGDVDRFIIGSGHGYGVKPGDIEHSTIDTGMGHRDRGDQMTINQVFEFTNGICTKVNGQPRSADLGLPQTEAAYTFVMK